jgi:hypothetical protein
MEVIEIELTSAQIEKVAHLVRHAAEKGKNLVFVSTVSPSAKGWKWQLTTISATLGPKLLKFLETSHEQQKQKRPKPEKGRVRA